MTDYNTIVLQTLLILNIVSLCVGFCIGRLTNSQPNFAIQKPKSFFDSQKENTESVSIDEKKYVVPITSNFEKKYDDLGETKNSQENISSSVDKLKSLKK